MYLLDYKGEKHEFNYDIVVEDISLAWIEVISGDEVLTVVDKNQDRFRIDSGRWTRLANYYDGSYDIIKNGKFVVDDKFHTRKDSYWFWNIEV